eukprot:6191913-Pleurochrysis_carterae.AAC.3
MARRRDCRQQKRGAKPRRRDVETDIHSALWLENLRLRAGLSRPSTSFVFGQTRNEVGGISFMGGVLLFRSLDSSIAVDSSMEDRSVNPVEHRRSIGGRLDGSGASDGSTACDEICAFGLELSASSEPRALHTHREEALHRCGAAASVGGVGVGVGVGAGVNVGVGLGLGVGGSGHALSSSPLFGVQDEIVKASVDKIVAARLRL